MSLREWWARFRCNKLGWHTPKRESARFNPASFSGVDARCERCNCRLLMDSQFQWFEVPDD